MDPMTAIPFPCLPPHILLKILVKMKWIPINKARKTAKWMLQFISDNWHVIVKQFHCSSICLESNNKLYGPGYKFPKDRTAGKPLNMKFEGFKGLKVGVFSVSGKNVHWDSIKVSLIETIFTTFDVEQLSIWSPRLPYAADLFEKIRPDRIVLNATWNPQTWSRSLPALHNASYLKIHSCLDFSFLSEKVKGVRMRELNSTAVKNYILDCRLGKIKPAPFFYIQTVDAQIVEKLGSVPHDHFTCPGRDKEELYVVGLLNSDVLGIGIEDRRDEPMSFYSVGILQFKSLEEATKCFREYGSALKYCRTASFYDIF